jgi:hypothetical protein
MHKTALVAALLVLGATFPLVPAAAVVEAGCEPTDAGYRCLSGPIEIVGGEANQPEGLAESIPSIPEAGYITSARAALVDEDGKRIDHHFAHLHHAVWLDASRRDYTCSYFPTRFFATGKERTRMTVPDGYGYYWSNEGSTAFPGVGTDWLLNYHIDGMHSGHDLTGYLRLNLTFVPAAEASLTPIVPLWLDVDGTCDDSEFDILRGDGRRGVFRQDWEYWMPEAGRIIGLAGHLHDGGIKLRLRNQTADTHLFTSRALYGSRKEPEYLTGMTTWTGLPGHSVAANNVLQLRAVYDSTEDRLGAMGIMMALFLPGA